MSAAKCNQQFNFLCKHIPSRGEQGSVDSSKAGQSHKYRNQPGHHTKMVLTKTLPNSTKCMKAAQKTKL